MKGKFVDKSIIDSKSKETKIKKNNSKKYFTKRNIIVLILVLVCAYTMLVVLFIHVNKNKDIDSIVLETNGYEMYEWKYDIKEKNIIKYTEKKTNNNQKTEEYYFKALKPGKTSISFTYANTKNGSFLDVKNYTAIVDKHLNLSIEAQK